MFNTLKDRKFWTGLMLGCALAGSVAVLQPLNAAAPAESGDAKYLKAISGAMLKMIKSQEAVNADLAEIKANTKMMSSGIGKLVETQTVQPSTPSNK
ncbi:MAG: hypothetical protein CVV27_13470 [Candidatus Melainabacteria bacterium HGW-Melainabacteria-1]|nr:MAG: hypothetical protein CVV27_13470 [Candidatus Melainabacteria bacterium HGW-Melainabacteria-1]